MNMDTSDYKVTGDGNMGLGFRAGIIAVGDAAIQTLSRIRGSIHPDFSVIAMNTEWQSLLPFREEERFLLGRKVFRGIGSGGSDDKVRSAMTDDWEQIRNIVRDWKLTIIFAGLGGSTGSVASGFLADWIRAHGSMVLVFAITPFSFEGVRRRESADNALGRLRRHAQALVEFPNDLIIQVQPDETTPIQDSYGCVDSWVQRAFNAWSRIVFEKGLVNIDFSKIQTLFNISLGRTLFALGQGRGDDCINEAVKQLIDCPLIQRTVSAERFDKVLLSIRAGRRIGLPAMHNIADELRKYFPDGEFLWNAVQCNNEEQYLDICVLAVTDINDGEYSKAASDKTEEDSPDGKKEAPAVALPATEVPTRKKLRLFGSGKSEQPDLFSGSEKSLYRGMDLDTPTFIRKGVKVL